MYGRADEMPSSQSVVVCGCIPTVKVYNFNNLRLNSSMAPPPSFSMIFLLDYPTPHAMQAGRDYVHRFFLLYC